ncbi:cilia- and flagella-associated protein 251-like, partial [Homarus americanus]|uniref:cilia- and flagella-associated protein 251-like n=1 Tax=Homarus americanus TaxID=6706 RepID=UPI001C46EA82
CQLRAVEKRHNSRRRRITQKKARTVVSPDEARPYTPPEDTGSEVGTTEASTSSTASGGITSNGQPSSSSTHHTEESDEDSKDARLTASISGSTSSDIDSMIIQHRLDVQQERYAHKRHRQYASGESCNGPSDLEVAAVLGVDMRPAEHRRERPRSKSTSRDTSSLLQSNSHSDKVKRFWENVEESSNRHSHYISSRRSSRQSNFSTSEGKSDRTSSQVSLRDSQGNRRRPSRIFSSLEGQLDDNLNERSSSHQDSIEEFSNRPGSSKSRRRQRSLGKRGSKRKTQEKDDKVDSFYSQQVFTSSSGSEAQVASGNATEEIEKEEKKENEEKQKDKEEKEKDTVIEDTIMENTVNDEAEENEGAEELVEYDEQSAGSGKREVIEASISSEVKYEGGIIKGEEKAEEEAVVDSVEEPENQDESEEITTKVKNKSGWKSEDENTISEDVREDSDIVTLCCSEAEVVEEDGEKRE